MISSFTKPRLSLCSYRNIKVVFTKKLVFGSKSSFQVSWIPVGISGIGKAPIRTFSRNNFQVLSTRQHEGPSCCQGALMIAYHAEKSHMHVARIEEGFFWSVLTPLFWESGGENSSGISLTNFTESSYPPSLWGVNFWTLTTIGNLPHVSKLIMVLWESGYLCPLSHNHR